MGAGQSSPAVRFQSHGAREQGRQLDERAGAHLKARIQLLEELCAHVEPGRRAQVLQQLAGGQADNETLDVANVLSCRPPEFQPGQLIAAGSYGRVYAGTYADQPAALKLLLLDEETAHAILNEVRLCLKLNHKNLVQLLDCAVVATNKQAVAAGFPVPATSGSTFAGQHQILPVFGATSSPATPSAANAFSYFPVVSSSKVPFSSSSQAGAQADSSSSLECAEPAPSDGVTLSAAEALQQDSSRPVLSSSLAHACFEVWIAMELCDGGTLAEQLQRGFHCFPGTNTVDMEQLLQVGLDIGHALTYMHRESVCHGDLKTENVLLKTLSPSSAADLQRCCSSGGSTCCHEDCWLTFLCNNSSTGTSSVCPRYCRSCSGDSCWSCYSRAMGCVEGGSSSPDTSSTCSSGTASGPNAERRSKAGFKTSHLLSGLCCLGSPSSCATEDDVWHEEERATLSGCFACGSCGVMTLEPSAPSSRHGRARGALAEAPVPHHYRSRQQQLEGLMGQSSAAAAAPGEYAALGQLPSLGSGQPDVLGQPPVSAAAIDSPCGMEYALPTGYHPFRESLPPAIMEESLLQQLQVPLLSHGSASDSGQHLHGGTVLEDVPEEEHVAPLSLYTQARQRRRSRCLPHGVVLPAALAAAAAAAAMGNGSEAVHGSSATSSNGSTSSGSDEEVGASGLVRKGSHGRSSLPLLQPGSLRRQSSLDDSLLQGGQLDAAAAAGCSGRQHSADAFPGRPSWQEGSAPAGALFGAAPVCHDVYAHSMMRPPVPRGRARRHSYCYGTSSSYPAPAPVSSFSRQGQPSVSSGISATAAAAAIAAAAEAARHEGVRGSAPERGNRRNRRMSWDDRMLRQQSPGFSGLSGLLGAALPGLPYFNTDAAAAQPAPAQPPATGRRNRRHSWAGYLQPDMSAAAGALGWGMHLSSGMSDKQQREQGPMRSFALPPSSFDSSWFGASPAMLAPMPRSSRAGRKARRQSWAGYAGYGQEPVVPSRLSGLRTLGSCFAAGDDSGTPPQGLQISPPRSLFSLPQFPGCCGDSSCLRPLDDPGDAEDCSRHALLDGVPSSTVLLGNATPDCLVLDGEAGAAASVGCFGRWCSSGSSLASSSSAGQPLQRGRRQRRYSWCCGAGSEAELWADLTRIESFSQVGLLPHSVPLSVPLQQQQPRRPRRDRRFSWDDFRYHAKPSGGYQRRAVSLDVQVSARSSFLIQPLSEESFCQHSLFRSNSDAAAAMAQLGMDMQSDDLPHVAQLHDLSDASSRSPSQRAANSPQLMKMLGSSCNSTPVADRAAGSSLPHSCTSSPAATQGLPAVTTTAAGRASSPAVAKQSAPAAAGAASGPAAASAFNAPAMLVAPALGAEAGSAPVPADTRPDMHADQSVSMSGPNVCLGWAVAASKTSRVRVSLDQPLPLSPSYKQQQHGLPSAAADAASSAAVVAPDCGAAAGSSRDAANSSAGMWQAPMPAQQQHAGSSSCAGGASTAPAVRQVTVQDLLTLCQQTHSVAAETPTAAAAVVGAGALDPEAFTGTFTLHQSASRNSMKLPVVGGAAGGSKPPSGRGRRWSTGVAAHQLLIRKQLLDVHGSDVLLEMGIVASEPAAPCSSAQAPAAAAGSAANAAASEGVQAAAALPAAVRGTGSVPVAGDADMLGFAATVPRAGSGGGSSSASRMGSEAVLASSNVSAAINVLGMPRPRQAVVSQRRMSYDTALGAYQMVAQRDSMALNGLLGVDPATDGQQQAQQQQHPALLAQQAQAQQQQQPTSRLHRPAPLQLPSEVQPVEVLDLLPGTAAGSRNAGSSQAQTGDASSQCSPMQHDDQVQDQQLQQHCQAQMQRLLEALAKKGYGGLDAGDGDGAAGSSTQAAHGAAAGASGPVASLQHQRQVEADIMRVTQRSFCAKVCDFGFSKCLRVGQSHCSTASAGTITHQAPEVLRSGHLSPAADVYAFGIILWELLVRDRPFKGLLEGDLVVGVCDQGLRPTFPPGCPASYVALAQQCWADDPSLRPTAPQLVQRLNELLYEERRARLRATVGAVPAHHAQECRRRRRHSMPVAFGNRQRRRSRRMSLFLLPFARQPVVPEDAPLEEQVDRWPLSGAHAPAHHSAAGGAHSHSAGRSCAQQQQQAATCSPAPRVRRSSFALSWGAQSTIESWEGHACGSGGGSSTGNAVALSGGLLASTGAISRLKGMVGVSGSAAAPAGSGSLPSGAHSGPAAANTAGGDGTEWFESL